jgi:hypothetical protein
MSKIKGDIFNLKEKLSIFEAFENSAVLLRKAFPSSGQAVEIGPILGLKNQIHSNLVSFKKDKTAVSELYPKNRKIEKSNRLNFYLS